METKAQIAKAIARVMQAVKNIEKNMNVGTGSNSYSGVADKDVKLAIGQAMIEAGLVIVPIKVDSKVQIDRWEENTQYGAKQKQSVFTEVTTRYLLLHESGESIEVEGYGHGVDSQDKSAGKATTYALKNTLLYLFMVPTGKIDDTDKTHSEESETPPVNTTKPNGQATDKPWLNPDTEQWHEAIKYLQGEGASLEKIEHKYRLSKANKEKLINDAAEVMA